MERPQPMELTISWLEWYKRFNITAMTERARNWIEHEAPTFGEFHCLDSGCEYTLRVFSTYSYKEVAVYLEEGFLEYKQQNKGGS